MVIFKNMARGEHFFEYKGKVYENGGFEDGADPIWNGLDAAIYLHDVMLENTGHRIWGITFTLFPNGKFDIEYSYSKPAEYDESDDSIGGEEIAQSLQKLMPESGAK